VSVPLQHIRQIVVREMTPLSALAASVVDKNSFMGVP
jgi:hypothetical protein